MCSFWRARQIEVLNRGIVFIDLAIAQVAGLGVTAADAFGFESEGWRVQVAAVGAALVGALLLIWTEKKWSEVQKALVSLIVPALAAKRLRNAIAWGRLCHGACRLRRGPRRIVSVRHADGRGDRGQPASDVRLRGHNFADDARWIARIKGRSRMTQAAAAISRRISRASISHA